MWPMLWCEISPFIKSNESGYYLSFKETVDNLNKGHKKLENNLIFEQKSNYENFFHLSSYYINRVLKQKFSNNDL